jgi:hypothetical protein
MLVFLITAGIGCKKPPKEEAPPPPVAKPVERPPEAKPEEAKPLVTEPEEKIKPEEKPKEEVKPKEKIKPEEKPEKEKPVAPVEDEQALVLKQAEKIAQIFGTYATTDDPPYKNLRDLKAYGTSHFNSWLDTIIKDTAPTGPFHGWATTAVSSAILESDFEAMTILVTCRREEFLEAQRTPKIHYQMLMIKFKKVEEEWKVDWAQWL